MRLALVLAALLALGASGSAVAHLFHAFIHRTGCFRPVGGLQAVPDSLARRLRSRGGTVLTDARVAEIQVRNGRACGVTLADGREIRALMRRARSEGAALRRRRNSHGLPAAI